MVFLTTDIFYPLQFGFREKHSTNHAWISMTEAIRNTIGNGRYGCGIFIDLKKAFDTVKGAVGSADLKISKTALLSLNHHNFSNTELIYTE